MKAPEFSQTKRRQMLLVLVFALVTSVFSLGFGSFGTAAQAKLTLADILTALKSKKVTLAQRNKIMTDAVWERGVTFTLTPEIERELRATGASNALIEAIRQNGPRPIGTPTPVVSTNTADSYKLQGDKLFDDNNFKAAILDYNRALQLNPNHSMAYVRRGFSYHYLGDANKAYRDYEAAMRVDPTLKNVEYMLCIFTPTSDNASLVVEKCNETINKYNSFSLAYFKRAMAYRTLRNDDQALKDYSEAIRLYPNFAYAYNNRSVIHINVKKNYSAAISDASAAIRIDPRFETAYFNRGLAYFYLENYNSALTDFNQFIRLVPNDAEGYYFLGRTYFELDNYAQAVTHFSKVISINKDYIVESYRYRGISYYEQGNHQAAINDYTEAIRIEPTANTFKNRALAYEAMGRKDLAAVDRRRAQQLEQQ